MDPEIRTQYEQHRSVSRRPFPSACYAPFTSLYFNTNGDVVACCKNTSYVLGNVATESLDEIWHGKRIKALRKALADYRFGLGCEFCEWQIDARQFDQAYTKIFDELPLRGPDPEWPSMLEFTISNTCNLGCIMCYGELSSTIRAQRENLPPLPKVYDNRFFDSLRPFLAHLEVAKFFGGEPFLAQENYRVWDMMIEDGIEIPCHVTTNGTQWNAKVERVLESFPVHLSISVDGATKATAESIRLNMHFETVQSNVERFLDYTRRRGTGLSLTYCLMRQNWHEFGDYLKYAEDLGVTVFVNTVIHPPECSLYTLPVAELEGIVAELDARNLDEDYVGLERNGGSWDSALDTLRKAIESRQSERVQGVRDAQRAMRERQRPDHLGAAWRHFEGGDADAALDEVRKVPSDDPNAYEARVLEGRALRALGRLDESLAVLDRAVESWRKAPGAYVERGWTHLERDDLTAARAEAEEAERMLGERGDARLGPAVHHLAASVALAADDPVTALRHVDRLVALAPRAEFFAERAAIHERLGSRELARADAEWVLEMEPEHSGARELLERLVDDSGG